MALIKNILKDIDKCRVCADFLPHTPRPVLRCSAESKILIIGQAPGTKVHESGIPWDDLSGKRLRQWMGLTNQQFYDTKNTAIIPMGFCFPGLGKSGDLPPRKECAPLWHNLLLNELKDIKLKLYIGQYAQKYYLRDQFKKNLTETVQSHFEYSDDIIPLPHPSPRNIGWFKKNPWFESELIPILQAKVDLALR